MYCYDFLSFEIETFSVTGQKFLRALEWQRPFKTGTTSSAHCRQGIAVGPLPPPEAPHAATLALMTCPPIP